jgi:hypothetical protein
MTEASTKGVEHKLPDAVVNRLRTEYLRAVGASEAAEAARQVAQTGFNNYQQRLASCLEMIGLDPSVRWYVDFDKGTVTDALPTSALNGTTGDQTTGP